ncbi:hypothetical protein [Pontixanthobacter gangjinensis]|uniref:Sulfotransferase family protein n=1 Tax=Pontixanthobacter gangjinensis TaxID=1028742 RepID=A0A6I4SRK6_9SPHN|nr:hypothetical protein [Pontixanthobacter gangjinensis]MXO57656.1 hypothetical protein [Pontixanthobacter gangjinensis]
MSSSLVSSGTLLPVSFKCVGGRVFVRLINPARIDLSRPFFRQALPSKHAADKIVLLQDWLESFDASTRSFDRSACIFHVARCGSTLLCQNIKKLGEMLVLSEPAFCHILDKQEFAPISSQEAELAFTKAVAEWQNWAATQQQRLVIKFNSLMSVHVESVTRALRDAKFLLLYRDPAAVLESLLRKQPPFVLDPGLIHRLPLLKEFDAFDSRTIELSLANQYCLTLSIGNRGMEQINTVNFNDLVDRFPHILTFFGAAEKENFPAWDGSTYAKSKTSSVEAYEPTPQSQIDEFAQKHSKVLAVAQLSYSRMRSKPSGFGASE